MTLAVGGGNYIDFICVYCGSERADFVYVIINSLSYAYKNATWADNTYLAQRISSIKGETELIPVCRKCDLNSSNIAGVLRAPVSEEARTMLRTISVDPLDSHRPLKVKD